MIERRIRRSWTGLLAGLLGIIVIAPIPPARAVPSGAAEALSRHSFRFEAADLEDSVTRSGIRNLRGRVTDLAVALKDGSILAATAPDRDISADSVHFELTRLDRRGKMLWRVDTQAAVKDLAISADGSLSVIATYEDELRAFNGRGRELWKAPALCRPYVLDAARKILCYNDDDEEPAIAFDVFDWKGGKVASFPIARDVMALKLSEDQRNIVLALTGGQLLWVGPDFVTVWQRTLAGEISEIAVSSGPRPRIAALYNRFNPGGTRSEQHLAIYDERGTLVQDLATGTQAEQVELAPDASMAFIYRNNAQGQALQAFGVGKGGGLLWTREVRRPAYTSATLTVGSRPTGGWDVTAGFEDLSDEVRRHSHLLTFRPDGKVLADVPVANEDSSYIYAAPGAWLAIGFDQGTLVTYQKGKARP